MKQILHTISSMGIKSGGTSSCLYNLLVKMKKYDICVLSYQTPPDDSLPGEDLNIITVTPSNNLFKYSSEYKKELYNQDPLLYHTHGLWEYTEMSTARIARKKNKPYIITPHGMLYPEALSHSKLKKDIFLKLFLFNDLNKASVIHATCEQEMIHIRNLGITTPIAVIPNSVNIPTLNDNEKTKTNKIRVGYLGRIHARKNIDKLIRVWSHLQNVNVEKELVIIGSGDDQYIKSLRNLISELQLNNVILTGFLSGKEKDDTLKSLNYLVVPSDFENFGMIVPEALALKVPVIASTGTPWKDLIDFKCGWWVKNDEQTLTHTIHEALIKSTDEQAIMGENGRKLVIEKYSLDAVSAKMEQLYKWILKGGNKPEFVYLK